MAERDADDPYTDPATGVFYNKLGITDKVTLDRAEVMASVQRAAEWAANPRVATYDLAHLRAIHRHLFEQVYPWAGELRTVPIAKGNTLFAQPQYIEAEGRKIFAALARERDALRGSTPQAFAERAAYHMGEINALHPFREGNGRTQRAFIGQWAREYGHNIAWAGIAHDQMQHASIEAEVGNAGSLAKLLASHTEPYRVQSSLPRQADASLVAAFAHDQERIDVLRRSYAVGHPTHAAAREAAELLAAVRAATRGDREAQAVVRQWGERGAAGDAASAAHLLERSLGAARKAGVSVGESLQHALGAKAAERELDASEHELGE